MNINIALNLDTPEGIEILKLLLKTYDKPQVPPIEFVKEPVKPKQKPIPAEKPTVVTKVTDLPKEEKAEVTYAPTATTHTLESVRAIAHTKKKDDVRALLTEFGVEGLTKLLPAQYDAFMVSLNKLS